MENVELLKNIYLFHELSSYEAAKIGKVLHSRHFDAGTRIFSIGEEAASLFIVKKGAVNVAGVNEDGTQTQIARLGPGDHFGEVALLDEQPRSANIYAGETSELMELNKKDFEQILATDSTLSVKIYRAFAVTLCARLRATNDNLLVLKKTLT